MTDESTTFARREVERIICETIHRYDRPSIGYMRLSGEQPEYDEIIDTALAGDHWLNADE